ncbi:MULTISPECIES: DUF2474 domain-containing protein [Agrobacterium]|uniref:DUF2474 domain-containing protein n=1 Tax=Agrobacterium TaxID=357 RepID=UPI0030B80C01
MVHACRSHDHHSDNPDLHRLGLLGFPRQGWRAWLSLMQAETSSIWKRLGWMFLIWAVSVAALGLVTVAIRYWLVG